MLVIKLGGSILKEEDKIVSLILQEKPKHKQIIVVTSAIGRLGDPYATDTLDMFSEGVSDLEKAQILACGEIISGIHLASLLKKHRLKVAFKSVYDIGLRFDDKLTLDAPLDFANGDVLIIPGFVALRQDKLFLLGRGSSNLTAIFLADYYHCNLLIISDTNGIYNHLPTRNDAKKIDIVDLSTLILAMLEAPRLFPFSVIKYLKRNNTVIYYRNLIDENGSLIGNFSKNSLLS